MVLKPEPVFAAFEAIPLQGRRRVLLMTPQGHPLRQADLRRWAQGYDQLVLLCGHYEGFDERIRGLADEEISIGDFVLTGGELPAATVINGVVRLLPGTVGTAASLEEESHTNLLLEHPHYTRPAMFRDQEVPAVLRSGDHGQFDEGAAADQDLPAEGVGLRQQALTVAQQVDLAGLAKIGNPRLSVVGVRCQQGVGEHETSYVSLRGARVAPGLHGGLRHRAAAACQAACGGEDRPATRESDELTARKGRPFLRVDEGLRWREARHGGLL
jgi:hypothetical protein